MEKDNICGSDIYCSTSVVNAYLCYEQDVIIRASQKKEPVLDFPNYVYRLFVLTL